MSEQMNNRIKERNADGRGKGGERKRERWRGE